MCIIDENPQLIDTKMCLFQVERHVRCVVTELVIRKGSTNNKPPMFVETEVCRPYHWIAQKRPATAVKKKLEEGGVWVLAPGAFVRALPPRESKNALFEHGIRCCHHLSLENYPLTWKPNASMLR